MSDASSLLLRPVLCAVQGVPAPGLAYDPAASRGWGGFVPANGDGTAPPSCTPSTSRPARLLARRLAEAGWLHRAVREEAERGASPGEGDAVRAARAALRDELGPVADALARLEGEGRERGGSLRSALPALVPLAARLEELAAAAAVIGGGAVTGGALAAALASRAAASGVWRVQQQAGGGGKPPQEQLTPTPGAATARLAAAAAAPVLARAVAWVLDGALEAEGEGGGRSGRRAGDFFVLAAAASAGDAGLWRSAHALDKAALPPFAPASRPAVAADILAAGRAVAFLAAGGCGPGAAAAWAASPARSRLAAAAAALRPDDVDGVAAWAADAAAAAGAAAAAALLDGAGGRAALTAVHSFALAGGPAGAAFAPALLSILGPALRSKAGSVSELSLDAALGDALAAAGGPPDGVFWAAGGGSGGMGDDGGGGPGPSPSSSSSVPAARLRVRLDRRLVAAAAATAGGATPGGPTHAHPPPTGWDAATLRLEVSGPVSTLLPPSALETVADAGRVVWALARAGAALEAAAADLGAAGRAAAALAAAARAARRAALGSGGTDDGAGRCRPPHQPARRPPPQEPRRLWTELAALGSLRLAMAGVLGAARSGAAADGVDAALAPLLACAGGEAAAAAGGGLDALAARADGAWASLAARFLVRRGVPADDAAAAALDAWLAAVRGVAAPARALARAAVAAAGRAADGCGWGDEGAWATAGGGGGPPPSPLDPALDADLGAVGRARAALSTAHRARLAAWVAALPASVRTPGGEGGGRDGEAGAAFRGVAVVSGL